MTTTPWRLGRGFLVVAALCALAALVAAAVLDAPARFPTLLSLAIVAGVLGLQGVVWTAIQYGWFGSPAALRRTTRDGTPTEATIASIRTTSSAFGADPVVVLDLDAAGRRLRRRVRVPALYAANVRPGRTLPVRLDPHGGPVLVVDWDRLD